MIGNQLLVKCLDAIEADPSHWYQGTWAGAVEMNEVPAAMLPKIVEGADAKCGTTACLAGHAMLLSGGYKAIISRVEHPWDDEADEVDTSRIEGYEVDLAYPDGTALPGSYPYVETGADLLDLPHDLAKVIFLSTSWDPNDEGARAFTAWVRRTITQYAATHGDEVYPALVML